MIVYEKFRNIDMIKKARCPVFFLHGQQDTLIPPSHSQELHAACPMECYLHLPEKMDHNEFQLDEDLVLPFKDFIKKLDEQYKNQNTSQSKRNEDQKQQVERPKSSGVGSPRQLSLVDDKAAEGKLQ